MGARTMGKLTQEEKAARAEARKALQAERMERERQDREIIADALRTVFTTNRANAENIVA